MKNKINKKENVIRNRIHKKDSTIENKLENKSKAKRKQRIAVITFIIIDVIVAGCFFITYGPVKKLREFLITTAMTTQSHKYLAHIFYSDNTINEVLSKNKMIDFTNGSDASQVVIGGVDEPGTYASKYEKEILEHEEGQEYKLIQFEYNGYNCYMAVIYDPTRVSLMQSAYIGREGQTLTNMSATYGARVAVNGGGFIDVDAYGNVGQGNGGIVAGVVIKDGKILNGSGSATIRLAGFNNDGVLVLSYTNANHAIANGIKDAVQADPFPFLIVNGVSATILGDGGWGINPRTVIAQRQDGIVLFLAIDGNGVNRLNWSGRGGVNMADLLTILERYGAYNAVNMDGGASTTLVMDNKLINQPCGYSGQRRLPNAWMYK